MKNVKLILSSLSLTVVALASNGVQAAAAPSGGQTLNLALVTPAGAIDPAWTPVGHIAALGAGSFGGTNMPGALPSGSSAAISAVNWAGNCPGYPCAGATPGHISQTLTGLTVGAQYQISFDQAAFNNVWSSSWAPIGWGQNWRWWNVSLGAESHNSTALLPNIITPLAGYTQAHTNWMSQTMTFTATSATSTLKFLAAGNIGDPEYLYLDNLKIKNLAAPVPEPSSYALMMLGLLGVGTLVRRNRKA